MDEADKYKQRLEAIAEKRRLQEEQDRARREMEDEKLRLQQLKRKSLRDQWLMEGAPQSPTSPDAQSPRSPLWGTQAQEMEKHIDKLQPESQRLAEEEEKLKKKMEDGQTEAVEVGEDGAGPVHDAVVQNGESDAAGLGVTEDEGNPNQSPLLDEAAAVLTNGAGDLKADTGHDASEPNAQSTTNGPVEASEGVIGVEVEVGLNRGVSDAEPGRALNVNINDEEEEEEEGTLVMRAERVIIVDEEDDAPEDLAPQEDQQEVEKSEESPLPNPEASQEGEEAVTSEAGPETLTQPEKSEAADATVETHPASADTEATVDVEDPACEHTQSPSNALEGTTVSSVPVYSQTALTPESEAEGAAATSPEGEEEAAPTAQDPAPPDSKAQEAAPLPSQFQEVPLADPQDNQRTKAEPGEQEPLLSQAKASDTLAEPAAAAAAAAAAAGTETHSPTRAGQGEEGTAPKRKTCQCCSVM